MGQMVKRPWTHRQKAVSPGPRPRAGPKTNGPKGKVKGRVQSKGKGALKTASRKAAPQSSNSSGAVAAGGRGGRGKTAQQRQKRSRGNGEADQRKGKRAGAAGRQERARSAQAQESSRVGRADKSQLEAAHRAAATAAHAAAIAARSATLSGRLAALATGTATAVIVEDDESLRGLLDASRAETAALQQQVAALHRGIAEAVAGVQGQMGALRQQLRNSSRDACVVACGGESAKRMARNVRLVNFGTQHRVLVTQSHVEQSGAKSPCHCVYGSALSSSAGRRCGGTGRAVAGRATQRSRTARFAGG